MNEDPREVLALLNSLGFVGITAEQLKGFMKDLKLYRKIKEREKQQRKEQIKQKIIDKQKNDIKEILRERKKEFQSTENTISTDTSNSYNNEPLVKVKVKCLKQVRKRNKENKELTNYGISHTDTKEKINITKTKSTKASDYSHVKPASVLYDDENSTGCLESRKKYPDLSQQDSYTTRKYKVKTKNNNIAHQEELTTLQSVRPMSAPNILEHERIGSSQTKSILSTKTSRSGVKSFIRPWKLQPEAQKGSNIKKSDPVALYQKYQQEWKQISFPGEAKHAGLRWAIREKMLGYDPHSMPIPKKSTSMPILKKK
ncbi:centriolar and ciliogenesis-associated protein HYLS1-like [Hylaeus volcanicus]|uniref:centriolar and ciliogenesis-associated protein HYLS1-like n=1 Tax=Hylaeus volcanicus TaxID=313075 RepID=UPI0023B78EC4|nr:centriolar and ciliogenesis-associated protein HYLS1-like [Hylaeus volcanicus]